MSNRIQKFSRRSFVKAAGAAAAAGIAMPYVIPSGVLAAGPAGSQ